MTKAQMDAMNGIELLRLVVQNMDHCREDFAQRFTPEQLIQIGKMHLLSEWEFFPDEWTDRQVREALKGKVPQWDKATEKPVYRAA